MNRPAGKLIDDLQKSFLYLSEIIGLPVRDVDAAKLIGYVSDLAAELREKYPIVTGLAIKGRGRKGCFYIPWQKVRKLDPPSAIEVGGLPEMLDAEIHREKQMLLRETFFDKQVVDISGAKVVRVNDLHLLKEQSNLWMVHMDVGFKGLLRRLGVLRPYNSFLKWLFSLELKDKLISWKYIQPITASNITGSLHLKVNHARLSELLPADLSDILVDLGVDERRMVFSSLENPIAADTLQELPLNIRVQMAESLPPEQLARILDEMPVDEVVDLLPYLHKKLVNALFKLLPQDKVLQIKELLKHSEQYAGSIMNTQFIAVREDASVGEVIEKIKTEAAEIESLHYVYVVNQDEAAVGVVTLRQLLTSNAADKVSNFMRRKVVKVHVDTDVEDVAQLFSKYDFDLVPVVDRRNRILGIITMKDAFETVYSEIREKE